MKTDPLVGFTAEELTLGFVAWKELTKKARAQGMTPSLRQWLRSWELWDLACSPMCDEERKQIRYGHCLGWFELRDQLMQELLK